MCIRDRCNIPAYSTERVAHTVIMMILNFASTMQKQIGMLAKGDRSNFTQHLQVSHTEVNGKTLGVIGAGHIGMEVIKVAKALGMNILVHTRTPKADGEMCIRDRYRTAFTGTDTSVSFG